MNQLLPYEQLLSEKIQQAPVANMADAIWATIAQELDKDLPDDPGTEPPSSPTGGGAAPAKPFHFYFATGVVVTALVTTFILTKNNKPTQPSLAPSTQEQKTNEEPVRGDTLSTTRQYNSPTVSGHIPKRDSSQGASALTPLFTIPDSLLDQPVGRLASDSASIKENAGIGAPVVIALDSAIRQAETPTKKPRGLPGITDDDYKLRMEKKDSTKKNGP